METEKEHQYWVSYAGAGKKAKQKKNRENKDGNRGQ